MGVRSQTAVRSLAQPRSAPTMAVGVAAFGLLLVVAGAVALLADARAAGISFWGTSFVFLAGFPASILALTVLGWWIHHRCDPVVARWVLAVALSVLTYLVTTALVTRLVVVDGTSGPLVSWVGLFALGGHVLPFILIQATLLTVRDRVLGQEGRSRPVVIALFGVAAANFVLGAGSMDPGSPLEDLEAPLAGTWVAALGHSALWVVAWLAWLVSVLVGPMALWRAVNRSSQMARRRLAVAAVVSLLPVAVIASCVLVLPVLTVADLAENIAIDVLFTLFVLTGPLTAAGVAVALSGPDTGLRLRSGGLSTALDLTLGLLFLLAAVALSTLVAVTIAGRSPPAIVLGTVAVMAALWPVRRGLARRLLLRADPRLAVAATLVRDPRSGAGSHPARAVQDILRKAMEDPTVTVAVRLPEGGGWVSVDGEGVGPPEHQPQDYVTTIADDAGGPHAYITHRTTATDAAGTVAEVRPLLDSAVLEVAVRHQAEELVAQRARADRAAAEERRRLERDLHDGVQGRLLAVALDLQRAGSSRRADLGREHSDDHSGPPDEPDVLAAAVASLRTAIDEMRRLATGSAPETLGRHGLRVALADIARRLPVPVTLRLPEDRFDRDLETLTYLVVSEALTNAVKHARPCSVDVVVVKEHGVVGITVTDDGPGGANMRAGTGLRGLSERVQTAGGTFVVSDRRPTGTQVEVLLPCAR